MREGERERENDANKIHNNEMQNEILHKTILPSEKKTSNNKSYAN